MGYAEAIEQQMVAARWPESPLCRRFIAGMEEKGSTKDWRKLFADVSLLLPHAAPFYVAPNVAALLRHAADSLPTLAVAPADLPEAAGWVWLGGGVPFAPPEVVEDIVVDRVPLLYGFFWQSGADGLFVAFYAGASERSLALLDYTRWMWGQVPESIWKDSGRALPSMAGVFVAFVAFTRQRILTMSSRVIANRSARKRLAKSLGHIPIVRVVELRRREYQQRDESHDAHIEYSCQWLVRGHWHQYHTRDGLQPRWVAPYIKGPSDKPLKAPTITAYEVVR